MHLFRASEFGSCTKAQVARLMGYQPLDTPEHMQAIFDRGNTHEDECVAALAAMGVHVHDQQMDVEIIGPDWSITGHLDGMVISPDWLLTEQRRVLEIKSPASWAKFEKAARTNIWTEPLIYRYGWQISIYMLATGCEAVIACLDDGEVRSFGIEVPPFTMQDIHDRATAIVNLAEAGILPDICEQNDYPCPFAYLHETPTRDEADPELDDLIATWATWADQEKTAKAMKDEANAKIRELMGDRTVYDSDLWKVSIYEQAAPSKWDEARMVKDGLDPDVYKKKGSPSVRMKITLREEGGS